MNQGFAPPSQSGPSTALAQGPPNPGLGIDLQGVNDKLSESAVSGPAVSTVDHQQRVNEASQASADQNAAAPANSQWNGTGTHANALGNGHPGIHTNDQATAGAQGTASLVHHGTGWGEAQSVYGQSRPPLMSGALQPHNNQNQPPFDNHPGQWHGQGVNQTGFVETGGGSATGAPPGSPQADTGSSQW